jgi:hypothetical protein
MAETLFPIAADDIAMSSDECYTPKWVFDAMGLYFDLDVAAPPGGGWHVPADRFYTAVDDGLTQAWHGIVWCNPPFSRYLPWVQRWISHERGALVGLLQSRNRSVPPIIRAAEAVALIDIDFVRPDGSTVRPREQAFVAFRGVGTEPAERLAAASLYGGGVLYGRP